MAFLSNLKQRDLRPEIMDQPGLAIAQHEQALRGLTRINWISGSDRILWRPIRRLAVEKGGPIRVLDVATGAGDVLLRLEHRARKTGLPITFTGVDVSATAMAFARRQASLHGAAVEFAALDALNAPLPTGYDIIICSLFLHHLEIDQAEELLRRMGQAAGSMILVNDLIRSRLGYMLAYLGTRVLTRSPVVHEDGLQSVRAAFTMEEAKQLAARAGLVGVSLSWHWPFRFLMQWSRPHERRL